MRDDEKEMNKKKKLDAIQKPRGPQPTPQY